MKLKEVFEKSVQFFKDKKFETARLDAELLIAHALKTDRVHIYMKYDQPLSEQEISACRELIRRRGLGEPVAYIVGEKGFYGLDFEVGPGVLIPRPETESIVEEALSFIKKQNIKNPHILDLGAGTGCIGLSILKNAVDGQLVSVEKSEKAFEYLRNNTEALNLVERTKLVHADVNDFNFSTIGEFDVIVANPPYIDEADVQVEANVRKFEPKEALFADQQGFELIYNWSKQVKSLLKSPGIMLFEIGHTQGPKAKQHFESLNIFSKVDVLKDLSGLDRIIKSVR